MDDLKKKNSDSCDNFIKRLFVAEEKIDVETAEKEALKSNTNLRACFDPQKERFEQSLDCNSDDMPTLQEVFSEEVLSVFEETQDIENVEIQQEQVDEQIQEFVASLDSDDEKNKSETGSELFGEYNMAMRVIRQKKIRYLDPPNINNTLSYYNGHYWQMLNKDMLTSIVYSVFTTGEKEGMKNTGKFLKTVSLIIQLICCDGYMRKLPDYYFSPEKFAEVEYSTVFKNGIYNARNGTFSYYADGSTLPYTFAVDADYVEKEQGDTYYFDKLILDATQDKDTKKFAYEMLGYLCVPSLSAKSFFVLAGVGDSGKSVFGHFCETIFLGESSYRIEPHHLGSQFGFSNADTANIYTCLDMETRYMNRREVSLIKQISGEKFLRSEAKYQNQKTIPIRFKLLLATNGTVQCEPLHCDPAFYRRLQVIPFLYKTREEDMIADLSSKLQDEKSAILSKAVRKLTKCINNNGIVSFHVPKLSSDMKKLWQFANDYDQDFFDEAFVITGNQEDVVRKSDIKELYDEYCIANKDKMRIKSSEAQLMEKIKNLDPMIVSGKKRVGALDGDCSPRASFSGIKWKANFLDVNGKTCFDGKKGNSFRVP